MNLLAIDTSTENISFSVMLKDKIIIDFNRRKEQGSSSLVAYIAKYFRSKALNLKKIDAFVVGSGPGSFTGLRISFSIIKAFSLSLNKPIISLGSFFACAQVFKDRYEKIAIISDARRNLIYAATFYIKRGTLSYQMREKLTSLGSFVGQKKDFFFVSDNSNLRRLALEICPGIDFYPESVYPKACNLLPLAKDYYLKNKFTPLDKLKPLYIYPKTCQIRRVKDA